MQELQLNQLYAAKDAGTYTKLYFDMPAGIERIEIEYDYPRFVEETLSEGSSRREANIIDLGIYNEKGCLYGWSGSNRRSVFISSIAASPGYRHGIFNQGQWAIALGLYKIESNVKVQVTIRLYPRERKLFLGDLHLHTVNSDGSCTTAEAVQFCEKMGLDFIALTDHNNMKQNSEIGNPEKLSVIPGVEFTNYRGHANFFFCDPGIRFEDNFLSGGFDETAALFRRAKAAGALISVNHPFNRDCPWEFGFDNLPFDMIEVWNGYMCEFNLEAVAFWHELLRQGKKISAVGGSDAHAHNFGIPCTMIYAESPSPVQLLASLAAGRCCIAHEPGGPRLDMDIAGTGPGDTVPYTSGLKGRAIVQKARKGDVVKIINSEGTASIFSSPFNGTYTPAFPVEDRCFYRIELYRSLLDRPVLCGLSNPVYIGSVK
ncbi:MAG: CehA/McbA family metallohydrolase [Treponema sp.]|jgi:predicted metal-dependent phosphoesterase TrpH|nr:CehA/McbA family metallohydrolase [Treponema sp.]